MKILLHCLVGALAGVLIVSLMGALNGLPAMIRDARTNNHFYPGLSLSTLVYLGIVSGIPFGASIGAVAGLIVGKNRQNQTVVTTHRGRRPVDGSE